MARNRNSAFRRTINRFLENDVACACCCLALAILSIAIDWINVPGRLS